MRPRLLLVVAAGLALVPAGRVLAQDDVRAVLDRAIKAHGGEEKINQIKAARIKSKGRLELGGGLDFTQQITTQRPNKFREEMEFEVKGKQVKIITVFDGKKGAIQVNDKKLPLTDKITAALREAGQMMEMTRLVALRKKPFELAPLGEVRVNDMPAVGIRVSRKGANDVNLYFDKGTGLLAKLEHRTVDPLSGKELTEERIIKEYQKGDGVATPKKVTVNRDGQPFLQVEVQEVRHLDAVDDGEFTLPEP
jgi:hypothetical protein